MTVVPHVLTDQDRALLRDLRHRHADFRHKATAQRRRHPQTAGQRIADLVASAVGSWRFIIVQSVLLAAWIVGNAITGHTAWDPFPFILLNLLLSFQAAYTAPVIMMSQNRQAEIDRQHAETDFNVNVKAELEIELLHQKIDLLREQEILTLTRAVTEMLARLESGQKPA
ncbi:DUF1003 domain-containing protein [Ferrovibrio xuzhouensis]|uniref:DUF1003 domain-containing protein n=1 Tax=Ferrovibrio xuzhouensis TaxID=1576914 RepID=A0ABV7VEQ8_9PROT